jgi:hypothetical protein
MACGKLRRQTGRSGGGHKTTRPPLPQRPQRLRLRSCRLFGQMTFCSFQLTTTGAEHPLSGDQRMIAIINFCRHAAFVASSTGYISWSQVTSSSGMPCAPDAQALSRGQIGAPSRTPVGYQEQNPLTSCRVCRSQYGLDSVRHKRINQIPYCMSRGRRRDTDQCQVSHSVTVCDPVASISHWRLHSGCRIDRRPL